ncbi:glycosyltransferase [Pseudooceanicola algae]|uniref:glycosyltransferase n=1 Tax=Pseudooceanicola algae TaxID=1537215 RepID=UPI0018AD22E8|nr:glycosyltransferase [Pseudooceanicola algae]
MKNTLRRSLTWWRNTGLGRRGSIAPEVTGGVTDLTGFFRSDSSSFWTESASRTAFSIPTPPIRRQRPKIAMIGDLNLPQCRKYRVEQLAEVFAAADADYVFSHYEDLPRCMDILQDATHLLLYRLRSHPHVTRHLYEAHRLKLPILYDIDDPLFSVPAYATYGNMDVLPPELKAHFIDEAPHYAEVMNMADVVSVSTPVLRDHASEFTSRPVFLRRNFADRSTLEAQPRPDGPHGEGFRLCFASGSQGHEVDFAVIEKDVTEFLARKPDRKLVILGHFDTRRLPAEIRNQVETHAFTDYAGYLAHLSGCDAAIMPLADDLFNRCKSGVRVIDAASVGVPSLVGTVSDMQALVQDGRNGRVIDSAGDWGAALEDLASDRPLVREMGREARSGLETRWSARVEEPVIDPEMIRWIAA